MISYHFLGARIIKLGSACSRSWTWYALHGDLWSVVQSLPPSLPRARAYTARAGRGAGAGGTRSMVLWPPILKDVLQSFPSHLPAQWQS